MKKLYLVGLIATTFLASCIVGAYVSGYMLQSAMAVKTGGKSSKLQLQFRNGTSITSYNWGEFSEEQTKRLECQLTYGGNKPVEVTWNTTAFPSGWIMRIQLELEPKRKWWNEGTTIPFMAGETRLMRVVLEEVNGAPEQSESFTLNFIVFGETKKAK